LDTTLSPFTGLCLSSPANDTTPTITVTDTNTITTQNDQDQQETRNSKAVGDKAKTMVSHPFFNAFPFVDDGI
jgi:hypothetical protein